MWYAAGFMYCGDVIQLNVTLIISDSKSDLNKYEREWSSTNRAVIIENTMAEGKEHGYLDIRVTKRVSKNAKTEEIKYFVFLKE